MNPQPLYDALDLGCHAIIEASAGTGKTYTIERLVARILRDVPGVTLERILLLTYTEKATGELRERIRSHLETERLKAEGDVARRLAQAVESFDTAQIFTIHGFCQRVLQEYAFENNQLFDLELSGDDTIVKRLFREQLRTVWLRDYLPQLPPEKAVEFSQDDFFESEILRLACSLQADDLLLPEVPPSADSLLPGFARALDGLQPLWDEFLAGYGRLGLGKSGAYAGLSKGSIEPIWQGIGELLVLPRDGATLEQAAAWCDGIGYTRFRNGDGEGWQAFRALVPPVLRLPDGGIVQPAECPSLPRVFALLDDWKTVLDRAQLLFRDRHVGIMRAAALDLRQRYEAFKQEHGLIDFDDMLERVRQALMPDDARSAPLVAALRAKYWFALVDEFQDTDPVQWEIFRRLFVEHEDGPQRLILVGDPKQAIYGFRGADVNTYLAARETLVNRFGPRVRYSLETNYRSIPQLLEGLNRAFSSPEWFPPEESGARIAYKPVDWPEPGDATVKVARDGTKRAPICLVHAARAEEELTVGKARWRMAQFIGEEIKRLLDDAAQFRFVDPETGEVRGLQPGDCCILVRRRASARAIEEKLRQLGIPYTFYKKPGIYQSAEALHTSLMLGALADPDAARALHPALLSRFFGYLPHELAAQPAAVEQATREPFENWRELCRRRRWPELFRSLLEDTGLACREALQPDGDRRLANYRQLFQELARLAESETLDVAGLREQLDLRRSRSLAVGGDEDLHQIDTEKPKVILMTMHASKGLQYPIVFIADGFSKPGTVMGGLLRYHRNDRRVVEIGDGKASGGKALAERENADENRRLFYVALTRARFKVYLPVGWRTSRNSVQPLTPLLTPAFAPFWDRGDEPQNDDIVCHLSHRGELLGTGYPMPPFDANVEAESPPAAEEAWNPDELAQALDDLRVPPPLGRWRRQVDSYSSLARDHGPGGQTEFGEGGNETAADDWVAPPVEDTLVPPGAAAGSALHEILEAADFARVGGCDDPARLLAEQPEFAALVDRAMARNGLPNLRREPERSTRLELATMVWRALRVPLGDDGFRLADIPPGDRQTEFEFHLSENEAVLGPSPAVPPERRGLLNGFIDLVFRHEGRYYLVDWKSNALPGGYSREAVLASMEEHEYTLQYRIYALALATWLRSCLPDFSPARHLGGVYYLYVRGLNDTDPAAGVFHQPLAARHLDDYRQEVLDRLADRA